MIRNMITKDNKNTSESEMNKFVIKKSMRGKESLLDKISSANIKDWKDHLLIPVSFFEKLRTKFHSPEEENKTFGSEIKGSNLEVNLSNLELNRPPYINHDESIKANLRSLGENLQTSYLQKGLTINEVKRRREIDGPNKLPEKKKGHWSLELIHELTTVFSMLLWLGGLLAIIEYVINPSDTSNLFLAIVLWIVVVVTALFSFFQNRSSNSIIESFKSMSSGKATVIRDEGIEREIDIADLVVGDVVIVKIGEKIPADIRIFESNSLSVNNSGLTGESEPIKIGPDCGEKGYDNPLDSKNLIFFSSLCIEGSGKGVVIRTGKNTFMGKIADLAASAEGIQLSLEKELNKFIYMISIIAITLGVSFFFGGFATDLPLMTNFAFAIGIIVANVPEGLISCLTVTLALTARKLYDRNMMVKNMKCVETLGAITCICSDKTGTLTQNKMSVVYLWYDLSFHKVNEDQTDFQVDTKRHNLRLFNKQDKSFGPLHFAAVCGSASKFKTEIPDDYPGILAGQKRFLKLNPKATPDLISQNLDALKIKFQPEFEQFYNSSIDERQTDGDASECGILKFFEKIEPIQQIRDNFPQHRVNNEDIKIPFNSTIKCAGFLRKVNTNSVKTDDFHYWLAFKGAPDYLIKKCTRYLYQGVEQVIDSKFLSLFKEANQAFALKGERVLGFAYSKLSAKKFHVDFEFKNRENEKELTPNYPIDDLCFAGLIAMEDLPRPGVKEAIVKCKKAGIKVIMITGDQTLTAASIAYQIGIIEDLNDTPEVIMVNEGISSLEEAEKKSNTIIIDGSRLSSMMKLDDMLTDSDSRKGSYLREWLMKRDVVFARTSPDQKLIIVDGCQKLSHIVAVTGDGVNDSPAIKKADVGIAMGKVGTDVAKDAADILLLDDNFANIIKGIKQGRTIFDCLKKIISYCLATNIAELMPVIAFFIFGIPLPMTTILILAINVGTDIYPNITTGYERAESNIMDRPPRNARTDNLCTLKLFMFSYLFIGIIITTSGFLGYYMCLHDYGFLAGGLINMSNTIGVLPQVQDVFNKNDFYKGNSNAFLFENSNFLGIEGTELNNLIQNRMVVDFLGESHNEIDLRIMLYSLNGEITWGECFEDSLSYQGNSQVCYTPEAVKHARGAQFANTVVTQVSNNLLYRTITSSILTHILDNNSLNTAYLFENILCSMILYIPGLNYAFGVRAILFRHWVPCFGVFIILFIYGEITKYLIRNTHYPDGSLGFFYKFFRY